MHKNNFDFLRILFALCVVIAHCFPLSGTSDCDFLCIITNNQFNLSQLGVKGFFIISGYLIFQSLERSDSLFDYYWKRFLRLFPGLLVALVLTVICLAFIYTGSISSYFSNHSTQTYVFNNLILYKTQYTITGIFENNPYKSIVNGSLWTIPYEFTLYILLSFLFFFKNKKQLMKLVLAFCLLFLFIGNLLFSNEINKLNFILNGSNFFDLSYYFIAGSLLAIFQFNKSKLVNLYLFFAFLLCILSLYFNAFAFLKYITLPIIVIGIGIKQTKFLSNLTEKIGDLSYGIYIYSFPIQQILVHYFKLDVFWLMLCSVATTTIVASFSWYIIERKALSFKNIFKQKLTS